MASKTSDRRIPFVDLRSQHEALRADITRAIEGVLESSEFILGAETQAFEKEFAAYCGARHCCGVASGTEALQLALLALGIGKGDEVVVPALTFAATAFAVSYTGATPVFVDIDERTFTMDPSKLEGAITGKTKAVVPVHLYGRPVDMSTIVLIARRHEIYLVEDACQAHGASYRGQRIGSFGDAACFSFFPSKNLGGCGDGGAIVTSNAELEKKISMLRNYGQPVRYRHETIGLNSRLDSMQAAILRVKLKHLDDWTAARRRAAKLYGEQLKGIPVVAPIDEAAAVSVYHLYVIRAARRDALRTALADAGIDTGIHYDPPLHLQPCFKALGYRVGDFPAAEKAAKEVLSLPMYPEISEPDIERVARQIKKFYG